MKGDKKSEIEKCPIGLQVFLHERQDANVSKIRLPIQQKIATKVKSFWAFYLSW